MAADLTKLSYRQSKIYEYLEEYIQQNGQAPTFTEIMQAFCFRSMNAVSSHVNSMEKKGFLTHTKGEARSIRLA